MYQLRTFKGHAISSDSIS